jgi:NAD(P)-dependent dehydrogenase (short-subunit alcohol dehydrogenase family)
MRRTGSTLCVGWTRWRSVTSPVPAQRWRESLAGRVVVVTGASKGLGRSYARWLAANGARVVVNNRPAPDGRSTASQVAADIRASGGTALADDHSVADEAGCRAIVAATLAWFGRIDAVVCNAGQSVPIDVHAPDLTEFRAVMDVNFWGSAALVLAALPHMVDSGWGRIVLTTSGAGWFGDPGSAFYGASKSALLGFARSLALDLRDCGVHVNMISPSAYTQMSARFNLGRRTNDAMSPDLVAPVVGWLCSDACDKSGLVLHAGSGRVRRIMVYGGPAVDVKDDDVNACWPALDDMTGAWEPASSLDSGAVLRTGLIPGPGGAVDVTSIRDIISLSSRSANGRGKAPALDASNRPSEEEP